MSEALSASPTRSPLEYTAVASPTRSGNHSRTMDGNAGCITAMPTPIANVVAKSVAASNDVPRNADATPASTMPPTITRAALKRAMR